MFSLQIDTHKGSGQVLLLFWFSSIWVEKLKTFRFDRYLRLQLRLEVSNFPGAISSPRHSLSFFVFCKLKKIFKHFLLLFLSYGGRHFICQHQHSQQSRNCIVGDINIQCADSHLGIASSSWLAEKENLLYLPRQLPPNLFAGRVERQLLYIRSTIYILN